MQAKILNVDVETVTKGKNNYQIATVAYMSGGQARTQKIVSFSNPEVFKKLSSFVGKDVEVNVTKNDAGYNQWSSLEEAGAGALQTSIGTGTISGGSGGSGMVAKAPTSNYETSAERAARQVYIVKQSSLSSAIALATNNKEKQTANEIIETAQQFVDYVFDVKKTETKAPSAGFDDMQDDIPY
jgi:hypothetical protein